MDQLLLLKGNYLLVILLIVIIIGFIALYDNIIQKEYSMEFYFGIAMIVGITGAICVYINTLPEPIISEEILNGPPNF